jgi:hypothetical protein
MFAAPLGFAAYWFRWPLPIGRLVTGVNTVGMTLVSAEPTATFETSSGRWTASKRCADTRRC